MDKVSKKEIEICSISINEDSRLSNGNMVADRDSEDSRDSAKLSCPGTPTQPEPSPSNGNGKDSPRINTQQQNHNSNTYRPSFMINDILSDRHPVRNRSPVHPDSTTVSPRAVIRTELGDPLPGDKRKAPPEESEDSDVDISDIEDCNTSINGKWVIIRLSLIYYLKQDTNCLLKSQTVNPLHSESCINK